MSQATVAMSVHKAGSRTWILDVRGEVTASAEAALMDAYTQASDEGAHVLVLNFTGLEYMNSSGIGLLVTLLIRANRRGQRLLAVGLSKHYQHIFELTRLSEAIHVYETEAEALAVADAF